MARTYYFCLLVQRVLCDHQGASDNEDMDLRVSPITLLLEKVKRIATEGLSKAVVETHVNLPSWGHKAVGWVSSQVHKGSKQEQITSTRINMLSMSMHERLLSLLESNISEYKEGRASIREDKGWLGKIHEDVTEYRIIQYARYRMDPERLFIEARRAVGDNILSNIEMLRVQQTDRNQSMQCSSGPCSFYRNVPPRLTNPNGACGANSAFQAIMALDINPYLEETIANPETDAFPPSVKKAVMKRFKKARDDGVTYVADSLKIFKILGGSWTRLRHVGLPTINIRELMDAFPLFGKASESLIEGDGVRSTQRIINLVALQPNLTLYTLFQKNRISFHTLPKFLFIQLIKLPEDLRNLPASMPLKAPLNDFRLKTIKNHQKSYDLKAVINAYPGHWTATVQLNDTWFHMDDSSYPDRVRPEYVVERKSFILVYAARD